MRLVRLRIGVFARDCRSPLPLPSKFSHTWCYKVAVARWLLARALFVSGVGGQVGGSGERAPGSGAFVAGGASVSAPRAGFRGGVESPRGEDREWERSYRGRWAHDKVVRSTHGVNCTGSCSWNVFVKDGIVTWESQAVDYPSTGAEMPEYEPRGCPRGASFSWYQYSPLRLKYPYVRGSLLQMFREARARLGDPVQAWAEITADPEKVRTYRRQRGKGGFVRASWEEAVELIAAAHVHTIKRYGPTGWWGSLRSRRCRWRPMPPGHDSCR